MERTVLPWGLMGVLWAAVALSLVPIAGINALAPWITASGKWTLRESALGYLASTFFLATAVGSRYAGNFGQRRGPSNALVLCALLTALALFMTAMSPSLTWLFVACSAGGLGHSLSHPAANAAIQAMPLTSRARSVAVGVKQSGPVGASLAAGALMAPLAMQTRWEVGFFIGALLSLVFAWGIGSGRLAQSLARHGSFNVRNTAGRCAGAAHARTFQPGSTWGMSFYGFLMGTAMSGLTAYYVLFAVKDVGFSEALAARSLVVMSVAGILGRFLWAWASSLSAFRHCLMPVIGVGACIALLLLASLSRNASPGYLMLVAGVLGVCVLGWSAPFHFALVSRGDGTDGARLSGSVLRWVSLGMVVGPVSVSRVTVHTGSYAAAWSVLAAVCVVASLAATSGARPFGHSSE